jgi:cephalosporin hydroxylase
VGLWCPVLSERGELMYADQVIKMAELVQHMVYTEEEKAQWAKVIKEFNALWYEMYKQTWGVMTWRGVRVLKPATDLWVYQELIAEIKPDLIIETGTWHGGSALFMRDILDLEYPSGEIISIDIRPEEIMEKAKTKGITFWAGSSVDPVTVAMVKEHIRPDSRVMVILDSDHEREHVLKEIELYAPLVTIGSILIIEDGNNHAGVKAAISEFAIDPILNGKRFRKNLMCEKYMLTFNRDGFWEREK